MEFRDYLRIIQRRWIAVVLITGVVAGASYFVIQSEPTTYTARSEIQIKTNPYVFFTGDMPSIIPESFTKATSVPFIRSRSVLEQVILYNPDMKKYFPAAPSGSAALTDAVNALRARLEVSQDKDSDVIAIAWTDLNPNRAITIVNAICGSFNDLSRERQVQGVKNALKYIEKQAESKSKLLEESRTELVKLGAPPEKNPFTSEEQHQLGEIAALDKRLLETKDGLDRLKEAIDYLNDLLAQSDTVPQPEQTDKELDAMRAEIESKERQLKSLRQRHKEAHDDVRAAKEEIENLKTDYYDALKRHVEVRKYEATWSLIERIRAKELERANLVRTKTGQEERISKKRAEFQELMKSGPEPIDPRILKREVQRATLQAQVKGLEDSLTAMDANRARLQTSEKGIVEAGERLDPAPQATANPKRGARSLPLMLTAGLIVGVAAAFLLEYLNTTIRTEHDLKRYVNLPIFGVVLKIRNETERLLATASAKSPLSEVFNTIGAMLESHAQQHGGRVFMVASSNAGEGKSTITSDIAVALARGGSRVILVDADLRKAVLHKFFNLDNSRGLSTHLLGLTPAAAAEGESTTQASLEEMIKPSGIENLSILPAGPHPKNPVSLLKSEAFKGAIAELRNRTDIVLIDVPPVRIAVDTLLLAPLVDGILLLVSAGETNKDDVAFAKRLIDSARGNMVGCILNKATIQSRGYYYYYYYYDSYRYYREK